MKSVSDAITGLNEILDTYDPTKKEEEVENEQD